MKLLSKFWFIILSIFLPFSFLSSLSINKDNKTENYQIPAHGDFEQALNFKAIRSEEYLFFLQDYLNLHINLFDSPDESVKNFVLETEITERQQGQFLFWYFQNSEYGLTNKDEAFAEMFDFYIQGYATKKYTLFWNVLDDLFVKVTPKFINNNNLDDENKNKKLLESTMDKSEYHFINWKDNDNFSSISYIERSWNNLEKHNYQSKVLSKLKLKKYPSSKTQLEFTDYFSKFFYLLGYSETNLEQIRNPYKSFEQLDALFKKETRFVDDKYSGIMLEELIDNLINISNLSQRWEGYINKNQKKLLSNIILIVMNLFKIITNVHFYEKNPIMYLFDYNDSIYFKESPPGVAGASVASESHEHKLILLSSVIARSQISSMFLNEKNGQIISSQMNTIFHEIGHAVLRTTTITNSDVEILNKTRDKYLVKYHYTNMSNRFVGGKKLGYQKSYGFVKEIENAVDTIFDWKKYIPDNKLKMKIDKRWSLSQIQDEIRQLVVFEFWTVNYLYEISGINVRLIKDTLISYRNQPKQVIFNDKDGVQLLKEHKLNKLYIGTFNKYMNIQIEISLKYVDNLEKINSEYPYTIREDIVKAPGTDFIEEIKKKLNKNEMFKNKQFSIWKGYYKENVLLTNNLVSEFINSSNNKLSLDIRLMDDATDGSAIFEVEFIEDYLNYDNLIVDKGFDLNTKIIIFIVSVIAVSVSTGLIVTTVLVVKSKNKKNRS